MNVVQRELSLYDRQSRLPVDLARLQRSAEAALPLVIQQPGPGECVLTDLDELEISFVDDEVISEVHARFLSDPTATDVITFQHGEIVISVDTAERQAAEHGQDLQRELALYVVHGLLHLNGHRDEDPAEAGKMHSTQEEILAAVWPAAS